MSETIETSTVAEDDFSRCPLLNTVMTARALTRRYDSRLRPLGVTLVQFSVLMVIRRNPDCAINMLARKVAMDRSTLTRNIDLLVRDGLVVKLPGGKGNAKTCRLTAAGDRLLDRLMPCWQAAREEIQGLFGEADPDAYLEVLQRLAKG